MGIDPAASYVARLAGEWSRLVGDQRITHRPGSLTSVDLSGFTRLSERLALRDAAGAEELNATINAQFGPLIDIASRYGADVLQFGGDALLIWYEGELHQRRAAASAWLMQRQLTVTGRVETPVGPVRLRMSVGIATGTVTFALIGTTHRELLVLGPTATRTVELEGRASAGQILLDDSVAEALPRAAITAAGEGVWKMRRQVDAPLVERGPPNSTGAIAFVPPQMRPIIAADVTTAEHRQVTVAFVKIPGTDQLAGPGHETRLAALLDVVEQAADCAVTDFDVCWSATDIAPDGFKLLFFAGAPVALEDDAGRLLRTALLIADRCGPLGVQIGISTGIAFAAEVGNARRRTFAIIGDTVNLAARLTSAAQPGRPLASTATVRASRSWWHTGGDITLKVKGKAHPIVAHEVFAEADDRPAETLAPLVGREYELTTLLAAVRSGRGSSIELVGETGFGKSHLVRHVVARAMGEGVVCVTAAATPLRARTPHGAVARAFPTLVADDTSQGAWELSADDLVAKRDRLHADVVSALIESAQPTLFVVEDTQWLDDASRSLIQQLLAALGELPWTVLLTARPDRPSFPGVTTLELRGLSLDELVEIAPPDDGAGWLDTDLERLAASVDGNPMFFAEALRLPRTARYAVAGGRSAELLSQRLDLLSPAARRAVRALAVVGRPLSFELLSIASDQDLHHLRDSSFEGLLNHGPEGWWFASEPMMAVAQAGLARRERRRVHANTAALLEARQADLDVASAELALHHFHAGNQGAAWRWSRLAAHEARAAGALREASELLELAVEVIDAADVATDAERTLFDLAEIDVALGRFDQADVLLRDAWRRWGTEPPVRALLGRARAAEQAGRLVAARRFIARAARDQRCDPGEFVDALLLSGLVLHRLGRPRAAVEGCWRALRGAKELGDDRRRAQAHLQLEMIRWADGHRHAALHEACAESLFRRVGDPRGLGFLLLNRGVNRLNEGPWDLAIADCDEARDVLDRAGYLIDAALASMNAGVVLVRQGRTNEAAIRAHGIARTFRGLGWSEGVAYLDLLLAAAHSQRGETDDALRLLAQAEQIFWQTHNLEFIGETRRQRALCLLYARRPHEAMAEVAQIDASWFELDPVLELGVSWLGGHAALQLGELARADELLHRAAVFAEERRLQFDLARVAWSLEGWAGSVGSDEAAHWRAIRTEKFRLLDVTDALPALPI